MDLPVLDISCKRSHRTFDLLCLPLFSKHVVRACPCCSVYQYVTHFYGWIIIYGYTTFCLSIRHFMDILVVSTSCLLWIRLLWPFMYKFLPEHTLSNHMVLLCFNSLRNHQAIFQRQQLHRFTPATYESSILCMPLPTFVISTLF